jgi:hypothetical protein
MIAQNVVGQGFGHLGAAGIVGAEKENALFHADEYIRLSGYTQVEN